MGFFDDVKDTFTSAINGSVRDIIKFALCLFNLVCVLLGLAIVVIGVWGYSNGSSVSDITHGQTKIANIILMVAGCLVIIIAILGFYGTIRESSWMLATYGVLLSIILVVFVAIGVTALILSNKLQSTASEIVSKMYEDYDKDPEPVDSLQQELRCCGASGKADYANKTLPLSCCDNWKTIKSCSMEDAYSTDCTSKTINQVKPLLDTIVITALVVAGVELLFVICAYYLACSFRTTGHQAATN